ncbi:unnamed protein product [Phaeothamnion confervicola]
MWITAERNTPCLVPGCDFMKPAGAMGAGGRVGGPGRLLEGSRSKHYHALCGCAHEKGLARGQPFVTSQREKARKHQAKHRKEAAREQVEAVGVEVGARWPKQLSDRLAQLKTQFPEQPWTWFEEQLEGKKTAAQCKTHWDRVRNPQVIKGFWSEEEDERLLVLAATYTSQWATVAAYMVGRTPKQCRERFTNYLNPGLNTAPWSPEEDAVLLELHRMRGNRWAEISRELGTSRAENHVKNRLGRLQRQQDRTEEERENAMDEMDDGSVPSGGGSRVAADRPLSRTQSASSNNGGGGPCGNGSAFGGAPFIHLVGGRDNGGGGGSSVFYHAEPQSVLGKRDREVQVGGEGRSSGAFARVRLPMPSDAGVGSRSDGQQWISARSDAVNPQQHGGGGCGTARIGLLHQPQQHYHHHQQQEQQQQYPRYPSADAYFHHAYQAAATTLAGTGGSRQALNGQRMAGALEAAVRAARQADADAAGAEWAMRTVTSASPSSALALDTSSKPTNHMVTATGGGHPNGAAALTGSDGQRLQLRILAALSGEAISPDPSMVCSGGSLADGGMSPRDSAEKQQQHQQQAPLCPGAGGGSAAEEAAAGGGSAAKETATGGGSAAEEAAAGGSSGGGNGLAAGAAVAV